MADFNDLSCKMMFGREPPAIEDDPAMKQPCFEFCKNENLLRSSNVEFDKTTS